MFSYFCTNENIYDMSKKSRTKKIRELTRKIKRYELRNPIISELENELDPLALRMLESKLKYETELKELSNSSQTKKY